MVPDAKPLLSQNVSLAYGEHNEWPSKLKEEHIGRVVIRQRIVFELHSVSSFSGMVNNQAINIQRDISDI